MPARANGGSPAPTEAYLQELEQQLVAAFSARNAQIARLRRIRDMEEPVDIPAAYRATAREVRTPVAREQLKRVIGSLTANYPVVAVPPPESTAAARASAAKREKWSNAVLRRMEDDAARDVFGMFIDALVADGTGVMKLVYLPERWSSYPRRGDAGLESDEAFNRRAATYKKSAAFPLAWRDVDVTTFYPVMGEHGVEACLEISERPRRLMMQRHDMVEDARSGRLTPSGAKPGSGGAGQPPTRAGTVRVVEYWDAEHFAYVVDGHLVQRGRHAYGHVPYVMAHGDMTPRQDPPRPGCPCWRRCSTCRRCWIVC